MATESTGLKRTLTPIMLWGLGVGYVISGMYFGWNLGLEKGGTLGLALATFFIILLYVCFSFSYAELATAIPKAGGAFDYANHALGKDWGFITGMAQNIEFIFAPPAIAFAIGAYLQLFIPEVPILTTAICGYILFTALNIYGVKLAATFELVITVIAVSGLILFAFVSIPHFNIENLQKNSLPAGWQGAFAALPFAIWFFLGIEGLANTAEETMHPQRTISLGFGSAILTLVILCVLTFISSVAVAGWEAIVFKTDGSTSDSPLPLAIEQAGNSDQWFYRVIIFVGLLALIASFHGIILAAGRSTYEFGRVRYAPPVLGKIHHRFQTPANALLANMAIGILTLLTGRTADIIVISVFGALTLYMLSMLSLIRLRRNEPSLPRPYKVPAYPLLPYTALLLSLISFIAMGIYNPKLLLIYVLVMGICFALFKWRGK